MRKVAVAVACLLLAGCASMNGMERAWQVTHAIDAAQTLSIAGDECYEEQNWATRRLIGRRPSEADVVAWWAGTAIAHAWVSRRLEGRWRAVWQSVTLVYGVDTVIENHRAGIRVDGDNLILTDTIQAQQRCK